MKTKQQISFAEAKTFIELIAPDGLVTFQTFDDNQERKDPGITSVRHGTLEQHFDHLVRYSAKGAGIFVTVNKTNLKGRKNSDILKVRACVVDLDGAPVEPVLNYHVEPSILVESSAGRWHAYYSCSDMPLDAFTAMQRALADKFGGDHACCDLPRVMRLPGFLHQKVKNGIRSEPFMTRIEQSHKDLVYTYDQLKEAFPVKQTPAAANTSGNRTYNNATDESALRDALSCIDPEPREDWIKIAHALKSAVANFLPIFLEWSRGDLTSRMPRNYINDADVIETWNSLEPNRIGVGAVFNMAKDRGYVPTLLHSALRMDVQFEAGTNNQPKAANLSVANLEKARQYADFGGAFYLLKFDRKGEPNPTRLCNFTAEIKREVVKNDGLTTSRHYIVSGRLENGEPLATVDVPASEFDRLDWLPTSWGASAQITVGSRFRDHVVAAIKERSDPEIEQLCQHTGWVQFNDELLYLTASGGIGTKGLNRDASCELQGPLADLQLQDPVDPRTLDLEAVLDAFYLLQPDGMALLLLGTVMRAPLCHFQPATCSVYLQGTTGTYKSAIAGVLQGFYGSKFDGAHLPANWSSTENALEKTAFLAKDCLLVVDDFVARGTRQEVAYMHRKAERLLRAQGNQSGRSRMTSKAEIRNAFHPRGIVLATGEDVPNGHSLQARLVLISIAKGDIDTKVLSKLQKMVRDGTLATVMATFVQWLAAEAKDDKLVEFIEITADCYRHNIGTGGHARMQDNLANLLIGLRAFLDFAEEAGEVSSSKIETCFSFASKAAANLAALQTSIDKEASDAQRYVELIQIAVSSGKAHIEGKHGGQPSNPRILGWREVETNTGARSEAMGTRIGWADDDTIYLDPGASLSIVKAIASSLDNHLGSSQLAIGKSLREAGLLKQHETGRNTAKVSLLGSRRNVYALELSNIFDLDNSKVNPVGYSDEDIPF